MKIKLPNIEIIKKHPRSMIVIFIIFCAIMAWLVETTNRTNEKLAESEAPEAIDTFIPRGFVLVPIEVQNLASLDSIVGQFGVVDLYAEDKTLPVGRGLKLVRSPRDPSQFAVMVSESDSRTIVKHGQKPFHVTVQNPNQVKSEVQTKTQSTKIILEN